MRNRTYLRIGITICLGVLSRILYTGNIFWDKYLGDALYAVLFYLLIRLIQPNLSRVQIGILSFVSVLLIECFQLTQIPAQMARSEIFVVRVLSLALGTVFSFKDIAAYAVGILGIGLIDAKPAKSNKPIK